MNLYIVRHGFSQGNLLRIHQPFDSPLTLEGLDQAKKVAQRFAHTKIDALYSSPMTRAMQTAQEIAKVINQQIISEPLIVEAGVPSAIVGHEYDSPLASEVTDKIKENFHNQDYRHSDEETFWDVKDRVSKFMDQLAERDYENVVAVTHSWTLRVFVGLTIFGKDFSSHEFGKFFHNTKVSNTGITECTFDHETNKWILVTWNDHSHWME